MPDSDREHLRENAADPHVADRIRAVFASGAPFLLFEDARVESERLGRLYSGAREIVVAGRPEEVEAALAHIRAGIRRGLHAAGWLHYEAGRALEPRLMKRAPTGSQPEARSLVWFGLFEDVLEATPSALGRALPDPDGAWLSPPAPRMTRARYDEAFARVQRFIRAGDVYQINLSYRADVTLHGAPLAAYARLRKAGAGGWSAAAFDGEDWLLSTSPELFFRISDGSIEARPMKGTARRRADPEEDRAAAARLREDPKELAENTMIVDLLRNDISRVAERGSVRAPALYTVETYPTLHTLTSTVQARLRAGCDAVDALKALFPCGSITGAPKIRAMEIIEDLERDPRGVYTGAIGWMSPRGEAEFNVAIRTLVVSGGRAELGLGSGVVYDSVADAEWEECATKGAFVTAGQRDFDLIETMRYEPGAGLLRVDLHLQRLESSARAFQFVFSETALRELLARELDRQAEPKRVRLALSRGGAARVEIMPAPQPVREPLQACAVPLPVDRADFRLRHKTSLRGFYDAARAAGGAEEVVFVDDEGFVTEGSFTNVFLNRGGKLATPPLARGLLPGVLRAALLASGEAYEQDLRLSDLAEGFLLGNSLRGLAPARLFSRSGAGQGGRPAEALT